MSKLFLIIKKYIEDHPEDIAYIKENLNLETIIKEKDSSWMITDEIVKGLSLKNIEELFDFEKIYKQKKTAKNKIFNSLIQAGVVYQKYELLEKIFDFLVKKAKTNDEQLELLELLKTLRIKAGGKVKYNLEKKILGKINLKENNKTSDEKEMSEEDSFRINSLIKAINKNDEEYIKQFLIDNQEKLKKLIEKKYFLNLRYGARKKTVEELISQVIHEVGNIDLKEELAINTNKKWLEQVGRGVLGNLENKNKHMQNLIDFYQKYSGQLNEDNIKVLDENIFNSLFNKLVYSRGGENNPENYLCLLDQGYNLINKEKNVRLTKSDLTVFLLFLFKKDSKKMDGFKELIQKLEEKAINQAKNYNKEKVISMLKNHIKIDDKEITEMMIELEVKNNNQQKNFKI